MKIVSEVLGNGKDKGSNLTASAKNRYRAVPASPEARCSHYESAGFFVPGRAMKHIDSPDFWGGIVGGII